MINIIKRNGLEEKRAELSMHTSINGHMWTPGERSPDQKIEGTVELRGEWRIGYSIAENNTDMPNIVW
jgi:hypothetical protein